MKKLKITAFVLILISVASSFDVFAQTRIRFARGRTSASVSGTLDSGGSRTFILGARAGQYLSANVSSRRDCVTFTERGSTSTDFTTNSGDNYVYLSNACTRPASFTLTISIR